MEPWDMNNHGKQAAELSILTTFCTYLLGKYNA